MLDFIARYTIIRTHFESKFKGDYMNVSSELRKCIFLLSTLFVCMSAFADDIVPTDPNDIRPLLVGQSIPAVTLKGIDGKSFSLNAAVAKKPTVIIFYRGSWCPYCNTHLGDLARREPELLELGFQILAISPDQPKYLQESIDKHSIEYTLLSDSDMAAAKAFGLAFMLDDATLKKYKEYGIDLQKNSGQSHNMLPVPAAYLVTPEGKITFSFVAPDYKIRVKGDVLLAAAKEMVSK